MTLRQKLFLAFLFVVIIPITLLGMIIIELIITRSDESIANIVEHELALVQAHYQQRGEEIKRGLVHIKRHPDASNAISQHNQTTLRHHLEAWQDIYPQVDIWLVVDNQGHIIAQFGPNLPPGFAVVPFPNLLSNTLVTGQPLVTTELLVGSGSNDQHLAQVIVVPVGSENEPAGAFMAVDRLDNNQWPLPVQTGLSYGGATDTNPLVPLILVTQQQKLVATSLLEPNFEQILTPEIQEIIQLTASNNWGLRGRAKIGAAMYQLASEPIFDSQRQNIGSLLVGLPYRKYFGLQAQTSWIVTTMLVLSGVISLITASLIASAITQPIQNLIEKSGMLATGDLSVRASVSGRDEIAQLGYAFNRMASNLEISYEAIEQERRRVLAIIEASVDSIWVVTKGADSIRRVTMVNSALERMIGRPRSELVGKRCSSLMGVCNLEGEAVCEVNCPFIQPKMTTGMVHGLLPGVQGDDIPVEISYGHLTNRRGELVGLVHIMRDLTLRREVERLKADFISMVSHELRTPLGHIKGFASTLLQTDVTWDAETQRDFLNSIDREADRLTKLVDNLLQMSRIEANGLKSLERRLHHVDELIELILPELHQRANQHNLEVNIPLDVAALPILADIRGLELALVNLIDNAAKYSPPQTKITLWAESDHQQVTFHVQDQGAGIASHEQAHIFDRFYRIKKANQHVRGTGLGLAICKRMVEAHQGRIWVTSQPNQGACFSFSLPIDRTEEIAYA